MKVVHVVPALFGPSGIVGGAERYALEMARHMAEIVDTVLVTFGDAGGEERIGLLRIQVLERPWYVLGQRTNPFHLGLFRTLKTADVVHCHQQHVLTSSAAALWCRLMGKRVFVSDLGGGGWDVSTVLSTDSWFHGHLHISDYSRRVFGHAGSADAHVILGGVDVERFSPNSAVSRGDRVVFVGRLLPHKGIEGLIEALPDEMSLTVIGPPPDPATASRLRALAGTKDVAFSHGLDDDALVREYRQAMCVVLPSVYRAFDGSETPIPELLGQTLLEGMACGVPAICTDVASMPEVVEDGVTGFVVPPNDPEALANRLRWICDHRSEADAMGAAGRQRVLRLFTWPRVVQQCLRLYEASTSQTAFSKSVVGVAIGVLLIAGFMGGAAVTASRFASWVRHGSVVDTANVASRPVTPSEGGQ